MKEGAKQMRLHVDNYKKILEEKQIAEETVVKATGLSKMTYNWILNDGIIAVETLERIADAIVSSVQKIVKEDPYGCEENTIEFTRDSKTATVTFSQGRYISRIKKLAESHPESCRILIENKDGSILARVPVSWVKISRPKEITEEHKRVIIKI